MSERFVALARTAADEAERAAARQRAAEDAARAENRERAAAIMRSLAARVAAGDIPDAYRDSASGIGRFLGEYDWSEEDSSFVEPMREANDLWDAVLHELRPDWSPRRDRGIMRG